jgi:hypothetical protein
MEVDDRRASPERLKVTVSMLRQPEVRAGKNIATSTFREDQSRVVLTQRFREQDYHNASAVAVGVAGNGAVIDQPSATSRTLVLPTAQKKQVILISSAAAWEPERDVAEAAVALVNAARSRSVGDSRRKLSHERQEARLTDLASRRRRRMSAALSPARKVHAASGVQPALGNPHGCEAADPARDGSRSPLALKRHSPERSASQGGIRATAALH